MEATINNESTTTEPPPFYGQQPNYGIFKLSRFSLFLEDPFFQIIEYLLKQVFEFLY